MSEEIRIDPMRAAQTNMRAPEIRRFYKEAGVIEADGGWALALDGRTARTPAKNRLIAPARAIAEMIAAEWAAQGEILVPGAMLGDPASQFRDRRRGKDPRRDPRRNRALRRNGPSLLPGRGARGFGRDAGDGLRPGARLGRRAFRGALHPRRGRDACRPARARLDGRAIGRVEVRRPVRGRRAARADEPFRLSPARAGGCARRRGRRGRPGAQRMSTRISRSANGARTKKRRCAARRAGANSRRRRK